MKSPLEQCIKLIEAEIDQLNHLIRKSTQSNVALVNQIAEYIIYSGGKRIRPILLLFIYKALNPNKSNQNAVLLAAVIEFIHTSTLLHDDVVDESDLRRNQKSAHKLWGNAASVLVGDFLYSRSFQLMLKANNYEILQILANTTNQIAEGEVLQLLHLGNIDLSQKEYFAIIDSKTAILFASSCQIAAHLANQNKSHINLAKNYGYHLGLLFQIMDDYLDYFGDAQKITKNIGDDWLEGKITLPLIFAFNSSEEKWFKQKFAQTDHKQENLDEVITMMQKLQIPHLCEQSAQKHHHLALDTLNKMQLCEPYHKNLKDLTDWLLVRKN